MTDQPQKPADPGSNANEPTPPEDQVVDASNEATDITGNNKNTDSPPSETAKNATEQQQPDNTGETDDIQGISPTVTETTSSAEEEDDCCPGYTDEKLLRKFKKIDDLLDEKQRRMLSYVDQAQIHYQYYGRWKTEANEYFKLLIVLNKRLRDYGVNREAS